MTDHGPSDEFIRNVLLIALFTVIGFPWSLIVLLILYLVQSAKQEKEWRAINERDERERIKREEKYQQDKNNFLQIQKTLPYDIMVYKILSSIGQRLNPRNKNDSLKMFFGYFKSDNERNIYQIWSCFVIGGYANSIEYFPLKSNKFIALRLYNDESAIKIMKTICKKQYETKEISEFNVSNESIHMFDSIVKFKNLEKLGFVSFDTPNNLFSDYINKMDLKYLKIHFRIYEKGQCDKSRIVNLDPEVKLTGKNLTHLHVIDFNTEHVFLDAKLLPNLEKLIYEKTYYFYDTETDYDGLWNKERTTHSNLERKNRLINEKQFASLFKILAGEKLKKAKFVNYNLTQEQVDMLSRLKLERKIQFRFDEKYTKRNELFVGFNDLKDIFNAEIIREKKEEDYY